MKYRASVYVRARRVKSSPATESLSSARAEAVAFQRRHPLSRIVLEVHIDGAWEAYE